MHECISLLRHAPYLPPSLISLSIPLRPPRPLCAFVPQSLPADYRSSMRTRRKTAQSARSYPHLSAPARTSGTPKTSSDPCRRKPDTIGLEDEPALRASDVTLAAAVRSSGAT